MKVFKRLISVVVALVLVCSQLPFGVFAADSSGIEWSTTNLVEGQADIVLNNYEAKYLDVTLDGDIGYRLDYTITFNTNVATNLNYMSNMLRQSESDLISFGAWNDAGDGTGQLRFAENDITNISQTAVEGVGVIAAGVGYPISIVIMPDYVELYIAGQLQTMYLTSGDPATQIPVSKRIENGKVGFIGQGSHPDITISDIAVYCEAGVDVPVESEIEWSDNNIVAGQGNLTLDYFWKWLPTQIKGSESYKYSFNIVASETEGYRFPTVAVRDISANSDGSEGLYVVFNNAEDQIRIGYEYTTNSSLIAVATGVGFTPAGTYEVEIITTPTTIEVYMNGNQISFYDFSLGQYNITTITTKQFADSKAGFVTQGNVMDTQITDIAIYGEEGVEQPDDSEDAIEWSDTNIVEGQADIALNDYFWDWLPTQLKADASYKYNFNLVLSDTEGYRLPTIAVRDSSASSDGTEGLYIVFYGVEDQIRIGYEATTYSSLIGVAKNVGMGPADTYAIEVISTPDTIAVSVNGTPITFYDYSDGQMKQAVSVTGLKDGKTGFNAQGTVMDCQVTDIAVYGEAGAEQPDNSEDTIEWSETNMVEGQEDITLGDYNWDWLPIELDGNTAYKYSFNIVASETAGYRFPTVAVRDSSAAADGSEGLYVVFNNSEDQIRIGYEYTTNASLIAVATGVGFSPAGTYAIEIISTPETIEVYMNGTKISFYDFSVGQYGITTINVSGLKDGKAGFNAQGSVMDTQITDIEIYADNNAEPPQINAAAVENVISLINAIGTVTEESRDVIFAARDAYNALNDDEKELVTNVDVLKEAEAAYNQLTASQDIMLYSLSATDAMGFNHWTQCVGVTNVTGGGMKFNWKNAGTNMRQGINRAVKLDGLHAVFSGWETTKGSNAIAIYFADLDQSESYSQLLDDGTSYYYPLALILNGVDGTLGIAAAGEGYPINVIATSDNLKYEALAGKEWSMFMEDNGDGNYTITVNGVSGIITKEMFDACNKLTQTENVYMTICPWDWSGQTTGSLNIISLHDSDNVCANSLTPEEMSDVLSLIEKIKAIGIVTTESIEAIENCEAEYAKLNDTQKGCVVNYNVLLAARYRYEQLTQEVDEPCLKYYAISAEDLAGTNHWPEMLFYNDIADGGVKFEWINGGTNVRRLINREVTLDGLHMIFGGLKAEDAIKKVAIYCADLYDTAADWTSLYSEYVQGEPSILALVFDFSEGSLTAHVEGQNDVVIINDSCITYEYLKDVAWELKVEKNSNGDYVFNVAGATGVLPASLCDAANRLTNRDNSMYVTISPWNWTPYDISIDVLSIHGNTVVCAEELTEAQVVDLNKVIEAINDIYTKDGKILPESEEKFINAWELYDALATNLQPLVANYNYLLVAEEVLDVVLAIDGIGTVTYESGEIIEQIRQMYKDLAIATKGNNSTALQRVDINIDKRVMVGNYATLQKAISDYYNLRKGLDLNGYTPDDSTNNTQNDGININGDKLSPNTGDNWLFTSVIMLSSIVSVAVIIYKKKIRKES